MLSLARSPIYTCGICFREVQGAAVDLPTRCGVVMKKVPERCVNAAPAGTARERPLYVTRFLCQSRFCPRPGAAGRGPLFYLHPGRSPESQAKERQQQQDNKASHAANLPYPPKRSLRRAERVEGQPRNAWLVACRMKKNKAGTDEVPAFSLSKKCQDNLFASVYPCNNFFYYLG